ncbi:MAG: 2-oxo acid dehydrogenase subunit E2 [Gammaproteobacteria bacterium]
MSQPGSPGLNLMPWPEADHAAFGPVETLPLDRIRRTIGAVMARNWAMIPHVTHHDEADVTDVEARRKAAAGPVKLTLLAYLVKAAVEALRAEPHFNASLDAAGANLTLKKYFHIGVAMDTPRGLMVPVLRDCDRKSLEEIATEIDALARKAREKGLSMAEMSGGCFSISSLGHIGGSGFTPIINAPEVAILGVTRARWVTQRGADDAVEWRLMLPLSLSYDHRVIDGAAAARFTRHIATHL